MQKAIIEGLNDEKNKMIVEEINNKKQELEDLEHKLYKK